MHSFCMLYAMVLIVSCVCVFTADKRQTTAATASIHKTKTRDNTIILLNFYVYACLHLLL